MIQASPEARLNQHALDNMFVRNGTEMAPVSQFVTLRSVLGPEIAKRFNLYNTIDVNVNVAEGYSTGEVQKAIKEVAVREGISDSPESPCWIGVNVHVFFQGRVAFHVILDRFP